MAKIMLGVIVAALLGEFWTLPWSGENPSAAWAATSSAGPTVAVQATFDGFVVLTVTGSGFSPLRPVTITVQSSVLSFVISDPTLLTDDSGSMSFGPDEIVAPCHNGVVKGTATVTDGTGISAMDTWQTVCKPLRGKP